MLCIIVHRTNSVCLINHLLSTQDQVKSFGRGQMSSLNSEGVQHGQHPNLFLRRGAGNKLSEGERKNIQKGISNQRVCN